eukprot:c5114_g1_i1.p1 GENE.c5114_g1_i1~~c5114_g1_i1.p1  ORF type:complete len:486 (+),score=91.13 c5114_g1_i1:151-1608(+)
MTERAPAVVNMDSHTGLRGAAAVWVMVFHTFLYSKWEVDIQGSSLMPLFFLLSGFTLTTVYSRKSLYTNSSFLSCSCCCSTTSASGSMLITVEASRPVAFDTIKFYRNRFARTMPLYYATTLIAIGLWFGGYSAINPSKGLFSSYSEYFIASLVVNFIPVSSLFSFLLGGPIDGPGWTVCTLVIFWFLFPVLLPQIQRYTDSQLRQGIINLYYSQFLIVFLLFLGLILVDGGLAFTTATMNPLSRLPVFIMGMFAGLLCERAAANNKPLVWVPTNCLRFFPSCLCCGSCCEAPTTTTNNTSDNWQESDRLKWAKITDHQSISLLILTIIVSVIDGLDRYLLHGGGILGAVWLQAIVPFAQLDLIVALTQENTTISKASKFLRSTTLSFLGKISMSIYLVHWVVIFYICWIVNNGQHLHTPETLNCSKEYSANTTERVQCDSDVSEYRDAMLIPEWCIPISLVVSVVVAIVMFYAIEEPSRKWLRS